MTKLRNVIGLTFVAMSLLVGAAHAQVCGPPWCDPMLIEQYP